MGCASLEAEAGVVGTDMDADDDADPDLNTDTAGEGPAGGEMLGTALGGIADSGLICLGAVLLKPVLATVREVGSEAEPAVEEAKDSPECWFTIAL